VSRSDDHTSPLTGGSSGPDHTVDVRAGLDGAGPIGLPATADRDIGFARFFLIPAALFLLIQFALRMTYPFCVEPDDADLVIFSQHLALGYGEQAPLYSWLCEGLFHILGTKVVALAVMRTAVLLAQCCFLWLNARLLCADRRLALFGAFAVLLVPNVAWHGITYLTHTNLLVAACLAALYSFLRIIRDGGVRHYLAFGASCAAGMLSKYNFVWFVAALILGALTVDGARRRIVHRNLIFAVLVAGLLVLPHAVWVVEHLGGLGELLFDKVNRWDFVSMGYFARIRRGAWDAATSVILVALPIAIVVGMFFRQPQGIPRGGRGEFRSVAIQVLGRFFLIAFGLIVAQVLIFGVSRFHERWLQPYAAVLPLWLLARIETAWVTEGRARWFGGLLGFMACGYIVARSAQVFIFADEFPEGPYPLRTNYDQFAREIAVEAGQAPTIVTRERQIGGNLLLKLPQCRVICTSHKLYDVPATDGPLVIAWHSWQTKGSPIPPSDLMLEIQRRCKLPPMPPRRVHQTEIAPPTVSRPSSVVMWTVLRK